jgi:hypothetical protein
VSVLFHKTETNIRYTAPLGYYISKSKKAHFILRFMKRHLFFCSLHIDQVVDRRIILRWIFRKLGGVRGDWMELVQDRDKWRALVGTVREFRVP